MRKRIPGPALLALLLLSLSTGRIQATDNPSEPNRFCREFVGRTDDEIRSGRAIPKTLGCPTANPLFVFASSYIIRLSSVVSNRISM
jgi:hypothetical protein